MGVGGKGVNKKWGLEERGWLTNGGWRKGCDWKNLGWSKRGDLGHLRWSNWGTTFPSPNRI